MLNKNQTKMVINNAEIKLKICMCLLPSALVYTILLLVCLVDDVDIKIFIGLVTGTLASMLLLLLVDYT